MAMGDGNCGASVTAPRSLRSRRWVDTEPSSISEPLLSETRSERDRTRAAVRHAAEDDAEAGSEIHHASRDLEASTAAAGVAQRLLSPSSLWKTSSVVTWLTEEKDGEEGGGEGGVQGEAGSMEGTRWWHELGLARVFSIINVMLGSSMLVVPWAFAQSGLLPGSIMVLGVGGFCQYTSSLILRHSDGFGDFSGMCLHYLGTWAWHTSLVSSLLVLLGALMAFHTLMSDFFNAIVIDLCLTPPSHSHAAAANECLGTIWEPFQERSLAPLPIALVLFPFTNLRDLSHLSRAASYGVVAVAVSIAFIITWSLGLSLDALHRFGSFVFTIYAPASPSLSPALNSTPPTAHAPARRLLLAPQLVASNQDFQFRPSDSSRFMSSMSSMSSTKARHAFALHVLEPKQGGDSQGLRVEDVKTIGGKPLLPGMSRQDRPRLEDPKRDGQVSVDRVLAETGEPLEGRQAAHSEGWEQEAKAGGEDGVYSGPVEVPLLGRDSGPLSAILPVSYFVHNLVITLMQGPEPTHIKMRQHAAAFGAVSVVYWVVGALPVFAVAAGKATCLSYNTSLTCPIAYGCAWSPRDDRIPGVANSSADGGRSRAFTGLTGLTGWCVQEEMAQDFLMMKTKPWPDVPTSRCAHNVVRAAVLLQLLSIFPLVCGVIRGQLFTYLLGTIYPGALPVFLLNLCLVSGSSLVASLFPNAPGQVLGLVGAVSGTLYVCLLPILVHLAALGEQGRRVSATVWVHVLLMLLGTTLFAHGLIRGL